MQIEENERKKSRMRVAAEVAANKKGQSRPARRLFQLLTFGRNHHDTTLRSARHTAALFP